MFLRGLGHSTKENFIFRTNPPYNYYKFLNVGSHYLAKKTNSVSNTNISEINRVFNKHDYFNIKDLSQFKESHNIKKICGNDEAKLLQAYADYLKLKFNWLRNAQKGGDPASMI